MPLTFPFEVGQEHGQHADQRQERAHLVDETDARCVGQIAEHGCAHAASESFDVGFFATSSNEITSVPASI